MTAHKSGEESAVAIIGMAGRFPGAPDLRTFWRNLRDGVESRTVFTDDELRAGGVPDAFLQHPKFVRSGFVLDDYDLFDAGFFGINPREAEVLDPQHRLFLECAWSALENAAYDPETFPGTIGVFGGATLSGYLTANVYRNESVIRNVGARQATYGCVPDYMVTRVAYKLNLRGPAFFVQSACSTSLVAVHLACQSLVNHECDMVLAGGVSVAVPHRMGYLYEDGGMLSPDGICRTFDAGARGTVFGSGVAVVVLKRLSDALADRDTIHAVIRGSAVNNDGSLKVGFTAPGVAGQARVIAEALAAAGVSADTIGYVEAHGTGTELGDPIEIAALSRAFRSTTDRRQFCPVGSVKPNIGHLDAAAGVSSLIKAVLAMKHGQIPPTINYERPNPKIEFEDSPFFVNTRLTPWERNGAPRRAGVSSFGFGGTNAHIIVEEAPAPAAGGPSRPFQLLLLSARTETALETASARLLEELQRQPEMNLPDAAYTLAVGRRQFAHRSALLCDGVSDAIELLQGRDPRRVSVAHAATQDRPVVFMFPGQGSQYVDMGRDLYATEALFRAVVDDCCERLLPHLGFDLRTVLYPPADRAASATDQLLRTSTTQPALFVVELALARLWMSWGVRPSAMIGHSIGELVAAHLSGVMSLDDALRLVALRGRLMEAMPAGVMVAVPMSADRLSPLLAQDLWLSAINSPSLCVVSGAAEAADRFVERLARDRVECRRLHTSHAFHSGLMQDAVAPFVEAVRAARLNPPQIPFVSNLTGAWITDQQATDPAYWGDQIRQPVKFSDGVFELLRDPSRLLLEVGPGNTLGALVRQQARGSAHVIVSALRHPQEQTSDVATVLTALGRLWVNGASVDWAAFYQNEQRRRVPLPAYPFERQRFWVEPERPSRRRFFQALGALKAPQLSGWFHVPSWKRVPAPSSELERGSGVCLVFEDAAAGAPIVSALRESGRTVVSVRAGDGFSRDGSGAWTIDPSSRADYTTLWRELAAQDVRPDAVLHLWGLTGSPDPTPDDAAIERYMARGFYSLLYLLQAIGESGSTSPVRIGVFTDGVQQVADEPVAVAEKSAVMGPVIVGMQEYPHLTCRWMDLPMAAGTALSDGKARRILADLFGPSRDPVVAYRRGHRWVQAYAPLRLEAQEGSTHPRLRERGVYLITGGFGGIGLVLAGHLAASCGARLVLTGRRALPPRESWDAYLAAHPETDALCRSIRAVRELEAKGAEVLVGQADVTDEARMRAVVEEARARFGRIDGVVHAAGLAGGGVIQLKKPDVAASVLAPKVKGTRVLARLFRDQPLDFMALCSSLTGVLGGFGQVDYCAANAYLNAFAHQYSSATGTFTVSINWNAWREVGMAVDTSIPEDARDALRTNMLATAISNQDGIDAFRRILARGVEAQVAISPNDLQAIIDSALADDEALEVSGGPAAASNTDRARESAESSRVTFHSRPSLSTPYVAPRSDTESKICTVWQELLGIDRVGINDNFFDLGGHSLLAIRLMARINEVLGTDIPVAKLYDGLTVAFLAGVAGDGQPDESEQDNRDVAVRRREIGRRQREEQFRRRVVMRR